MADPFTWAAGGAISSLIGGGVQAYGSLQKGAADQAMYNYQAGTAQLNQKIATQNAAYTQEAGGSAAFQSGLKTGAIVGHQKANQGASGVDVSTGSPLGVRQTTTALGQVDQQLIRTNFAKKAYGFEVEAATKGAEAKADVIAGEQASKAGTIGAVASILGTAGSVSSKWLQASSSFGKNALSGGSNPFNTTGSLY